MWKILALAACCGGIAIPVALASEGHTTPADAQTPSLIPTTPTADPQAAVPACTPLRVIYSHRRWRVNHPGRGFNACAGDVKKWKASWALYRTYREVAPYRGFNEGDPWLKWLAVPSYIVACETRGYSGSGRWRAANSSGAVGPYQLLGWGAPYPATTPRQKVENHVIASHLSLSNWACA